MDIQQLDLKETRKIVIENGGRHSCGSNAIFYLPRQKGDRGLRSVEMEYFYRFYSFAGLPPHFTLLIAYQTGPVPCGVKYSLRLTALNKYLAKLGKTSIFT